MKKFLICSLFFPLVVGAMQGPSNLAMHQLSNDTAFWAVAANDRWKEGKYLSLPCTDAFEFIFNIRTGQRRLRLINGSHTQGCIYLQRELIEGSQYRVYYYAVSERYENEFIKMWHQEVSFMSH